jgi:uncharacterized OB-fold protein
MVAGLFIPGPQMVVTSDVRTGMPGGTDEAGGGDGAAAFLWTDADESQVLARVLGGATTIGEFLDRWRVPGETASKVWEERFGEHAYVPLGEQAVADALKHVGITAGDLDHVLIAGLHPRAARRVAAAIGARAEAFSDDLTGAIGNLGAAHPLVLLADCLDRAEPNQTIMLVTIADGAEAALFRTNEALVAWRERRAARESVAAQIASGRDDLSYASFLTWREVLHREPPRRPDPVPVAAPPSFRREEWKFGFVGSRCDACGTRHLPPARVCVNCNAVDQMTPERLADLAGSVATYTIDHLAFSLSPPTVVAVVDFDGGGRFSCELTDVDPATVAIGNRVEMTFRRINTAQGVHNYFWKARPAKDGGS